MLAKTYRAGGRIYDFWYNCEVSCRNLAVMTASEGGEDRALRGKEAGRYTYDHRCAGQEGENIGAHYEETQCTERITT